MAPLPSRRAAAFAVAALIPLTAAGCGHDSADKPSPLPPSASAAPGEYATVTFAAPFAVKPAPGLQASPIDVGTLLEWAATGSENNKIRFLLPVEIYPPGKTKAEPPPADFDAYLTTLASAGVEFKDKKQIQVDGHPVTLSTVTRKPTALVDGSFGCAVRGDDQTDDCYGPKTDLLLRFAVIKVGDKNVLAWARVPAAEPDQPFLDSFEQMLETVHFRARP